MKNGHALYAIAQCTLCEFINVQKYWYWNGAAGRRPRQSI